MNEILRQPKLWWLVGWLVVKFLLKGIKKECMAYMQVYIYVRQYNNNNSKFNFNVRRGKYSMKRRGKNILLLLHIHT